MKFQKEEEHVSGFFGPPPGTVLAFPQTPENSLGGQKFSPWSSPGRQSANRTCGVSFREGPAAPARTRKPLWWRGLRKGLKVQLSLLLRDSFRAICSFFSLSLSLKILFIHFRERGREGERGRETSMCERYIDWSPLARPQLGTWPTTQACALTGNRTCDILVCKPELSVHRATPARADLLLTRLFCLINIHVGLKFLIFSYVS